MTSDLETRIVRKLNARILPLVILLYFVSFLDRVNAGFAAFTMNKAIGLSPAVFGFGGGIFFVGYVLFQVPSNLILYRVGARRWIAWVVVVWGVVAASCALAAGPISFCILRFLLGAAEGGFFPGIILYLTLWFPARHKAWAVAVFMAAAPLSTAAGSPVSGAIMELPVIAGLANWQWLFILEGLPAVLLGLLVLRFLADRPEHAAWLEPQERAWLAAALRAEQAEDPTAVPELPYPESTLPSGIFLKKMPPFTNLNRARELWNRSKPLKPSGPGTPRSAWGPPRTGLRPWGGGAAWAALRNPRVVVLSLVYAGTSAGLYAVGLWAPLIIKQFGYSPLTVGWLNAIPGIVAIVSMIVWARHSDLTLERTWHVVIPCAAGFLGLLWAGGAATVVPVVLALSLANFGANACKPSLWAMPAIFLAGPDMAAGIAWINSIGNLGGFLGVFLIGWTKSKWGSYTGGLDASAAMMAFSAVAMLALSWQVGRRAPAPRSDS